MLKSLPAELTLHLLSYLPLGDISTITLLSRAWLAFLNANQDTVYRQAAIYHRFVSPDVVSLETVRDSENGSWMDGLNSWKDLCRRHTILSQSWSGQNLLSEGSYTSPGQAVHRFTIDEKQRTVIATHENNGLTVSTLEDDRLIWGLPKDCVASYAHLEFSNGYLIWGRRDPSTLEVWRRTSDARLHLDGVYSPLLSSSSPAQALAPQFEAEERAFRDHSHLNNPTTSDPHLESQSTGSSLRGSFTPHAFINPLSDSYLPAHIAAAEPIPFTRAFRFQYPILVVSLQKGNNHSYICIFDVRFGTLIKWWDLAAVMADVDGDARADGCPRITMYVDVQVEKRLVLVSMIDGVVLLGWEEFEERQSDNNQGTPGSPSNLNARTPMFFPTPDMSLNIPEFAKDGAFSVSRLSPQSPSRTSTPPSPKIRRSGNLRMVVVNGSEGLREMLLCLRPTTQSGRSRAVVWRGAAGRRRLQIFIASHFSPSGKHLVTVNGDGLLFLIRDFDRVGRGEATFRDVTVKLDLGPFGMRAQIRWEDERRICVISRPVDPFIPPGQRAVCD
ncbi:hypothetical protein JAAARDRAFT_61656 [Jaapia argillacea MUCL 33604]|uniref:F-box domain-containing protein n=1 Tax=Jaapia argillacea MUCL 33604 TaxID=933084 RepID=A0A067PDM7_9AGAM|nr:hypothetical protein JAAARDRAFT_61656 [Jaapia argillacea MUCL 33604]